MAGVRVLFLRSDAEARGSESPFRMTLSLQERDELERRAQLLQVVVCAGGVGSPSGPDTWDQTGNPTMRKQDWRSASTASTSIMRMRLAASAESPAPAFRAAASTSATGSSGTRRLLVLCP